MGKSIILLLAALLIAASPIQSQNTPEQTSGLFTQFAVFSDPHYFDPSQGNRGSAFEEYLDNDRKLLRESPALLEAAVKAISESPAQFVLVPGDLTKDGNLICHQVFSGYLQKIESSGKKVYVIPGNHDVSNPESHSYHGDSVKLEPNVSPAQFAGIYAHFGYDEALYRDPNSLSYMAEPVEGLWILALDACRYDENLPGGHPVTGGRLKPQTIAWFTSLLSSPEAKSKRIIAMMHHGVVEHYKKQSKFFGEYVVEDHDKIAGLLASLRVNLVFTGHYHAQDITLREFGDGKKIYDVETGSLVTYPCPVRNVQIEGREVFITSVFVQPSPFDGVFEDYSRNFVWSGIEGIARKTLVEMKLKEEEAGLLAGQVADAFVAHYQGDETEVDKAFDLKGVGLLGRFYISFKKSLVNNLYADLHPEDNEVSFDLP